MRSRYSMPLLALLMSVGLLVWLTCEALPPVVASHFSGSGEADGYMSRSSYRVFMLVIAVGVPLLVGWLPAVVAGRGGRHLNIPNRGYWLAPERRETTVAFIRAHGQWFAAALAVFLVYVHLLVVQANASYPAVLATPAMIAGLAIFLGVTALWVGVLWRRFRSP